MAALLASLDEGAQLYQPRAIEQDFERFLDSNRSAMAIVAESGMGKSTLVARLASHYSQDGHLCALFVGDDLPAPDKVEAELVHRLSHNDADPAQFWATISAACMRHAKPKRLILFIDAVNNYGNAGRGSRPSDLLSELNAFVLRAYRAYPGIKVVITSRPETWRKGLAKRRRQFAASTDPYYGGIAGMRLMRFTADEFRSVYEKYRLARGVTTRYGELSELARYILREPFFLNLATKVYRREIPRDLDTGELFEAYLKDIDETDGLIDAIQNLVDEMFAGGSGNEIKRAAVVRDTALQKRNPSLYDALTMDEDSPIYKLKERHVLCETEIEPEDLEPDGKVTQVRFFYDRFAQFLLSRELVRRIREADSGSASRSDACAKVIEENLPGSQHLNVVFGALQQTLWLLGRKSQSHYILTLQKIADNKSHGLNLVISVLARTARNADGLRILRKLLNSFASHRSVASFPIIDAVFSILRDEEYRAWLSERPDRIQHLELLYGYFYWGFCHHDDRVSTAAVQYLFFLWRRQDSIDDATAATDLLVRKIGRLWVSMVFPARRRLLVNMTGLMILLLSEVSDKRAAALVLDATRRALAALELRRSSVFLALVGLLNRLMGRLVISILKSLPNPVNFDELDAYYRNRDFNLPHFKRVSEFLAGDCDPRSLEGHLTQLSQSRNSFVLQMTTFAMSVAWERAWERARPEDATLSLLLMRELFKSGDPVSEYCSSLAVYHVNVFGKHATPETLDLMAEMAAHILSERKGVFTLGRRIYDFNIIGTYGRALHKNRFAFGDRAGDARAPLQYAIDALRQAKDHKDEQFYLYICENIGLLGVLIDPEGVFDVIMEILFDVGEIKRSEDDPDTVPFPADVLAKARITVLQSLANMRVLHTQAVDRYLFEELESDHLYGEVVLSKPKFRLATFYSWTFERLMFRVLTEYREEIGIPILQGFMQGACQKSARDCVRVIVRRVLHRVKDMSN
jgi:hypothetical protein